MGKWQNDKMLDAGLNYVKDNTTKECFCSAQPTNYAQATVDYCLASVAASSSDIAGPVDGDVSGRKLVVGDKEDVPVTTSGTGTHVALVDETESELLYVTTCLAQEVSAGGAMVIPSWGIELRDVT